MIASFSQMKVFLLIDCPAQVLEFRIPGWLIAESLLHETEELSNALDEGLLDQHSRLFVDVILMGKMVHGQSWLDVAVVKVVGNVSRN